MTTLVEAAEDLRKMEQEHGLGIPAYISGMGPVNVYAIRVTK